MVKIAVLDSQKQFASEIKEITEKYMPVFGIEYELTLYWKAQDLLIDLKEKEFDIFLLATDIVECSEHEVAYHIKKENIYSLIIYVTNHVDYAPQEFELNPYRYIPQRQLKKMLPEAYKTLHTIIRKRQNKSACYQLKFGCAIKQIPYREIYYLERKGSYVWIIYKNGKIKFKEIFREVLNEFASDPCFSIIGKKYIVNILHVMSLKEYQVHLRDGNVLSINKRYLGQLRKDILNYWSNYTC